MKLSDFLLLLAIGLSIFNLLLMRHISNNRVLKEDWQHSAIESTNQFLVQKMKTKHN